MATSEPTQPKSGFVLRGGTASLSTCRLPREVAEERPHLLVCIDKKIGFAEDTFGLRRFAGHTCPDPLNFQRMTGAPLLQGA